MTVSAMNNFFPLSFGSFFFVFSCMPCADFLMTWGDFVEINRHTEHMGIESLIKVIIGRNLSSSSIFNIQLFFLLFFSSRRSIINEKISRKKFPFLKISFDQKKKSVIKKEETSVYMEKKLKETKKGIKQRYENVFFTNLAYHQQKAAHNPENRHGMAYNNIFFSLLSFQD